MATSPSALNIVEGGATFSVTAYVAPAAGAEPVPGTYIDLGLTMGGSTLDRKDAYHDIMSDQHLGILDSKKISHTYEIKTTLLESSLANWQYALDQPAAQFTGSDPTQTFADSADAGGQYLIVKIVGVGAQAAVGGTPKVRTLQAWKCLITDDGPIGFYREKEQVHQITVKILQELGVTTSTTKSQHMKVVDS